MLLGHRWQYYKQAIHDGFTNKYSFEHKGRKVTLAPLSPKQIVEDQKKVRKKEKEMREKEKSEKETSQKQTCEKEIKSGKMRERKNFFCKKREVEKAISSGRTMYLLLFKGSTPKETNLKCLPKAIVSLLQEYDELFPEELP